MKILCSIILIFSCLTSFSQLEKRVAEEAGKAYAAGDYEVADSLYNVSLMDNPDWLEAAFNKGDALYRKGDFDAAAEQFGKIAGKAHDSEMKAQAYHNLGNTHMSKQEFDKAAAAYRNALINNPDDEETRYNLAYAQKMLQQQQQQEQNQEQEGDEEQEEQEEGQDQEEGEDGEEGEEGQEGEEGDENQDRDQNQEGENDQEGDQEKDESGDQESEEKQDEQPGDQPQDKEGQEGDQQKEGEQKAQPLELSPEEAARILESLKQDERNVQAKVQQKKAKGKKVKIEKDW